MSLTLLVYLMGTLPSVGTGFVVIGVLATFCATMILVILSIEVKSHENLKEKRLLKACIGFFGAMWFIGVLIPDKETMYIMAAAYGVETLADNPTVQELGRDGLEVIQGLMKQAKEHFNETNAAGK